MLSGRYALSHHRHEQHERRAGLLVVVDGFESPARVESASSTTTVGVSMFESISTRNVDLKPIEIGSPS